MSDFFFDVNILLPFSLTLEASLREVTTLRQQILRIKGESSVSDRLAVTSCSPQLMEQCPVGTACSNGPRWYETGSYQ
jgi:hypothetical protein